MHDELRLLITLSGFWETDVSARISSMAFLSDATPTIGAVVRIDLDEQEQSFLWARARRGGWAT